MLFAAIKCAALLSIPVEITELAPEIDGVLDDSCWVAIEPVSATFNNYAPRDDVPMSQPTDIKLCFDSESLYIATFMYDPDPSSIHHQVGARDEYQPVDKFTIYLDTFNDNANCYVFSVTVDGIQSDSRITGVSGFDNSWNAVWKSATALCDSGWVLEVAIPFSVLRYSSDPEQTWGVNFLRTISSTNESGYMFRMKEHGDIDISGFGELIGLSGLPSSHRVEIRPFVAGKFQFEDDVSSGTFWGSAGVDLKVPLNMQSVLDLTILPDFGQIESDADQGNISHWAPWLPENRPFFMEGTEVFDMPFNMFYSRKIGSVAWNGDLIPILGGAKITGTSDKLRYGLLQVVTGRVWENDSVLVEGNTSYSAASLLEEFSPGNWLHVSATSVDTPGQEGNEYTYGRSGSLAGMLTVSENYEFKGKLGLTWNRFEPETGNAAFRFDAGYNLDSFDLNFRVEKKGENFDPSPMGYVQGNGETSRSVYSSFTHGFASGSLDRIWLGINGSYNTDIENRNSGSGVNTWFGLSTINNLGLNLWTEYQDRMFDRYEGPDGRWYNGGFSGGVSFSTDHARSIHGWVSANRNTYFDSWFRRFSCGLNFSPTPLFSFDINPSVRFQEPATRYNWGEEIWEKVSSDWESITFSSSYMLTSLMRIKLSGQISRFEKNWETASSSSKTDNFWANLLYSWEYLPGSWLYLLAGNVGDSEGNSEFTVYAKLTRFF